MTGVMTFARRGERRA